MEVQFFGVRGSIAVSGSRIGGNTACVEVTSQGHRLILDAGTGIRALGGQWMREGRNPSATLFFSHFHWDHVQGFPFFTPAYKPGTELTLYGPGPNGALDAQRVLAQQMEPPHFPVRLSAMHSKMTFSSARHGRPLQVGPFLVTPFEVPHPQGCMAYRIEADGHVFVYATDVELFRRLALPGSGAVPRGRRRAVPGRPVHAGRVRGPRRHPEEGLGALHHGGRGGGGQKRWAPGCSSSTMSPPTATAWWSAWRWRPATPSRPRSPRARASASSSGPAPPRAPSWAAACCPSTEAPRPAGTSPPGTDPQRRPARGPQPEPDACQESRLPGQPRCSGMARTS